MGCPGDAEKVVITTIRVVPQSEYFVSLFRGKVFFCSIKTVCVFVFVRSILERMCVTVMDFMPNAFLWAVPHTVLLLGVIMFGMGMTLHARDFKLIVQRPKEVLIGCTAHYTIMPLLAYALVLAFEMPPEIAVGMILLGSCPSGTASNVMGFLAKADVPLSVSITTCSTLLAPIMMPFIVWGLAGRWVEVSFMAMAMTVMKVILVPLVLGLLTHRLMGEKHIASLSKVLVLVSAFGVLVIVGGVIAINGAKILDMGIFIILMVLLHNLGGFLIGYFVTGKLGLGKKQQHSVTLEVGMQNDALAISLYRYFLHLPSLFRQLSALLSIR